jgi:hypothetical protein
MDVVIASLRVPGLETVQELGTSHPFLGPFLSGGSYSVVGEGEGAEGILAAARKTAAELKLPISVLGEIGTATDLAACGERGALCLIVDGAGPGPLAILYGRHLPALGDIPLCTIRDLQHTWIALAGGTPKEGRHLLHEQAEAWDPQLERQLTQRLRQLYGE